MPISIPAGRQPAARHRRAGARHARPGRQGRAAAAVRLPARRRCRRADGRACRAVCAGGRAAGADARADGPRPPHHGRAGRRQRAQTRPRRKSARRSRAGQAASRRGSSTACGSCCSRATTRCAARPIRWSPRRWRCCACFTPPTCPIPGAWRRSSRISPRAPPRVLSPRPPAGAGAGARARRTLDWEAAGRADRARNRRAASRLAAADAGAPGRGGRRSARIRPGREFRRRPVPELRRRCSSSPASAGTFRRSPKAARQRWSSASRPTRPTLPRSSARIRWSRRPSPHSPMPRCCPTKTAAPVPPHGDATHEIDGRNDRRRAEGRRDDPAADGRGPGQARQHRGRRAARAAGWSRSAPPPRAASSASASTIR